MRSAGLALVLFAALTTTAGAHYAFRFVGTVKKISATQIDVSQVKDAAVFTIDIDKKTKITRDQKPVGLEQIKVGSSVVIDALGDEIFDTTATEIRLVPAIPPK
jgi:hypothetical protein